MAYEKRGRWDEGGKGRERGERGEGREERGERGGINEQWHGRVS